MRPIAVVHEDQKGMRVVAHRARPECDRRRAAVCAAELRDSRRSKPQGCARRKPRRTRSVRRERTRAHTGIGLARRPFVGAERIDSVGGAIEGATAVALDRGKRTALERGPPVMTPRVPSAPAIEAAPRRSRRRSSWTCRRRRDARPCPSQDLDAAHQGAAPAPAYGAPGTCEPRSVCAARAWPPAAKRGGDANVHHWPRARNGASRSRTGDVPLAP
jgi:hypothetical protein